MKFNQIIIFALSIFVMTSCEEVVVLDLENDQPQIVIEAVVDATNQQAGVFLTRSNGFYENINLDLVTGASVSLTFADGTVVDMPSFSDGIYVALGFNAVSGEDISLLIVDSEGNEYKSTATVPHSITIDSIEVREGTFGPPAGDIPEYQVFAKWQDIENQESYYRIRASANGEERSYVYSLFDDVGTDGDVFNRPFFDTFLEGDTVNIQLLSLDKDSYRYFSDLSELQGGGGGTTPFNPHSNIDNKALGYFGIVKLDERMVIME